MSVCPWHLLSLHKLGQIFFKILLWDCDKYYVSIVIELMEEFYCNRGLALHHLASTCAHICKGNISAVLNTPMMCVCVCVPAI